MSSILFIALVLYPTTAWAFQTSKCQHVCERCVSAKNGCDSVLALLEEVCNISGSSCTVKESMSCNKTTQFLVERFPEFKDCICIKESCSIKPLIGKQCFSNKGKPNLSSAKENQLKSLQQAKSKEIAHTCRFKNDCTVARHVCRKNAACLVLYKHFQRVCRAEIAKCSLRMVGQQCFTAWKELRKTVLGNCECPEPMHKRCTRIWTNIFNNTCLQRIRRYHNSTTNWENDDNGTHAISADHMKIKSQWTLSSLSSYVYRTRRSCFQVNMECVNDEVCNKQLSLFLRICQVNGTQCNANRCQAALRFFYENMPPNVAQTLMFCDCPQSDENCYQARALLRGEPCAVSMTPVPSCLSVMHMCKGNSLCRGKLEAFTSKCLDFVTQECLEDHVCPASLGTTGLVCSNSTECRAAYVELMGTVLHVKCICGLPSPAEESACKVFHHIFHSKPCFSQISGGKVDLLPSHIVLPGKTLPATGVQPVFYGDTVYITACILCTVLFLGIILLTLLKTRACCTTVHRANTTLPAHLSERLMILQQPWLINCADHTLSESSR